MVTSQQKREHRSRGIHVAGSHYLIIPGEDIKAFMFGAVISSV
jgi:hypothetical protein